MKLLNILHLEDNPLDAELVKMRLEADGLACEISVVDNEQDFKAALDRGHIDLVLADSAIPGLGGGDGSALSLVKTSGLECPFIFVSGTIGEEKAVEFLKRGATDYVLKDRLHRLAPIVRRALDEFDERRRRKLAENQSNLFLSLINRSNDSIFVIEPTGLRLLYANDQACQSIGYALDDLMKMRLEDLAIITTGAAGQEQLKQLRQAGHLVTEASVVRRDGSRVPMEVNLKRVQHEKHDYLVAVARDITERKRLEEQLRQSQKMEAIGQLAGGVAHDFNNILTIIKGYTQLLLGSGAMDSRQTDELQQVFVAAERAANLTRQLLTFSRKQVMHFHAVDLNAVVNDLTRMLKRIIGEDITLEVGKVAQSLIIKADTGMMEQVLMNLAVNARDAMPTGGSLKVSLSLVQLQSGQLGDLQPANGGNFVCLEVADTGIGMSPEVRARVFEPFFTTKGPGKGTGLGLATVYGIVQQHQGHIQLESEPGKGTTFRIFFPSSSAVPVAPTQPATSGIKVARGNGEMILVVEDEPALRQLTRTILQHQGYKICEAGSGLAALAVWKENAAAIKLLLTDMVLPDGLTGLELAERLLAENPELRVVFTSGYNPDFVHGSTDLREGENFLQKPYPASALARVIRAKLDKK